MSAINNLRFANNRDCFRFVRHVIIIYLINACLILFSSQQVVHSEAIVAKNGYWHVTRAYDEADLGCLQAPFGPSAYSADSMVLYPNTDWDGTEWSIDLTVSLTGFILSSVTYSIAIDNDYDLYVNGQFIEHVHHDGWAAYSLPTILPNIVSGLNSIQLVIDGDGDNLDYFSMEIDGIRCESRPIVNVQFGDPNYVEMKTGPAAIGGGDSDFWNQLTYDPKGGDESGLPDAATVNCLDSHGNPTLTQVTFYTDDPGASHFVNFANDPLLDGCILSGGGEDWQLYVSLPSGTYDIFLYAAAPDANQNSGSTFQIVSGIVGVSDYSSYIESTVTGTYDVNAYIEGNQYRGLPITLFLCF